jgi:hypothetical protein
MYVLKQIGRSPILHYFGVLLHCIHSEVQKLLLVVEENCSGGFLVVAPVAGVEDLDAEFALLVGELGSDGEAA